METHIRHISITSLYCSYRTYEEWKLIGSIENLIDCFGVLTVPMRNGNLRKSLHSFRNLISSYRTYEEWKRLQALIGIIFASVGSYRTYEEWKHDFMYKTGVLNKVFLPYL